MALVDRLPGVQLFKNQSIARKLGIGFGILVSLTFLSVGVSYIGGNRATDKINRTDEERVPTALAASRAQANLLRMLSDVRGYLALGDPKYRDFYQQSRQEFQDDLADLADLVQMSPDPDPENKRRLEELGAAYEEWSDLPDILFELRDDQVKREPAYRLLMIEGARSAGQVLIDIDLMIELQGQSEPTEENLARLQDMAKFQGNFSSLFSGLRSYVTTRNRVFRGEYEVNLTDNENAWERLSGKSDTLTVSQQELYDNIARNREAFLSLPEQLFEDLEGERWREDLYIFKVEAVPLAESMQQLLDEMTHDQQTALETELDSGRLDLLMANRLIVGSGIITLVFGLALMLISRVTIAGPVHRLTAVAEAIRGGDLQAQARVESRDEVGTLAETFNNMTGQLRQTLEQVEQKVEARTRELQSSNALLKQEITERMRAEEELRHLRNYLSNIIDSMPSVLVGVDPDGKVTLWNNQAQRATGISEEDAVGQSLVQAFPRLAAEMERVREAMQTRKVHSDPRQARKEDGETHYEDVTVFPLTANDVEGAVVRVDDVTEQVRMDELMVQSAKMLSVGGLAAGMAHEINNPLAGMMQTASVMTNRLSQNIPANLRAAEAAGISMDAIRAFMSARGIPRMLTAINESGRRVADIVENMLSFARRSDTSQISSHDVGELLEKTLDLAATDYDMKRQHDFKLIEIVQDYEDNLPYVPCERAMIQQVLLNILRNGAEAMHDEKVDGLDLVKKPIFVLRTRYEKDLGMVCIEISDNGPGMPEEVRKRVFEPFYTTKPVGVGTGLGLSVSYFIIVENHGGEMDVVSEPGQGATFIIRLPVDRRGDK